MGKVKNFVKFFPFPIPLPLSKLWVEVWEKRDYKKRS